jgi:hypothetical protein
LYLSNTAAGFTPTTKRGTWTTSSSAVAKLLGRRPSGTATTSGVAETSASVNQVLLGRWISDPAVVAGTMAGTAQWVIGALESSTSADMFWYLHIYVTSGDTDTPRGTLLSNYTPGVGTEWTATATGRGEGAQSLSSVSVSVGDRICVEVGYQARNVVTTSFTGTINYGNTGTTDLAQGGTGVTTAPGWIEFSGADAIFNYNMGDLADDGSGGTLDTTTRWPGSYGTVSITGGRLRVAVSTSGQAAIYSGTPGTGRPYRLTNSRLCGQIPTVPVVGGGTGVYCMMAVYGDEAGTQLGIQYQPGDTSLNFLSATGFSDPSATAVTYSSTSHQWWQLRHDGTAVYWETSADGSTWTTQRTLNPAPSWMRYSDLAVSLEADRTTGTNDVFELDNVNVAPTANAAAALAVTATLTAAPSRTALPTAALSATATLTAGPDRTALPTAALSVTATLTDAATDSVSTQAALAAVATLTAAADRVAGAAASLAVTATLTAAPDRVTLPDAALAVSATLAAGSTGGSSGADAALAVTASFTAAATDSQLPQAALAVTASLTAAATDTQSPQAALAVVASLTAAAGRTAAPDAALAVVAALASDATLTKPVAAALSVTAALTAAAGRTALPAAALAVTAALTVDGPLTKLVGAALAITAGLSTALDRTASPAAALTVIASLVAAAQAGAVAGTSSPSRELTTATRTRDLVTRTTGRTLETQ